MKWLHRIGLVLIVLPLLLVLVALARSSSCAPAHGASPAGFTGLAGRGKP